MIFCAQCDSPFKPSSSSAVDKEVFCSIECESNFVGDDVDIIEDDMEFPLEEQET